MKIAQKLSGKSPEAEKMLAAAGIELPRVQIIKAEYGAGSTVKDVTEILQAATQRNAADRAAVARLQRKFRRRPGA